MTLTCEVVMDRRNGGGRKFGAARHRSLSSRRGSWKIPTAEQNLLHIKRIWQSCRAHWRRSSSGRNGVSGGGRRKEIAAGRSRHLWRSGRNDTQAQTILLLGVSTKRRWR